MKEEREKKTSKIKIFKKEEKFKELKISLRVRFKKLKR